MSCQHVYTGVGDLSVLTLAHAHGVDRKAISLRLKTYGLTVTPCPRACACVSDCREKALNTGSRLRGAIPVILVAPPLVAQRHLIDACCWL